MRLRIGVLALLVVILGSGLGSAQTKSATPKAAGKMGARRYINPPGAPSGLPFSEGVLVGDPPCGVNRQWPGESSGRRLSGVPRRIFACS